MKEVDGGTYVGTNNLPETLRLDCMDYTLRHCSFYSQRLVDNRRRCQSDFYNFYSFDGANPTRSLVVRFFSQKTPLFLQVKYLIPRETEVLFF